MRDLFSSPRPVILDGGLGTLLADHGEDVSTSAWSAGPVASRPEAVIGAHREFFSAGAQVAITASYQLSFDGPAAGDRSEAETTRLLHESVRLARRAADEAETADGMPRWVAASVGPYGAALADGSEYTGDYRGTRDGADIDALTAWHRRRLEVLLEAGPDLLALETIPSPAEAEALLGALSQLRPGVPAWLSLSADATALQQRGSLVEAFRLAGEEETIQAIGVNCCRAQTADAALRSAAQAIPGMPLVVYPNRAGTWSAEQKAWSRSGEDPFAHAAEWVRLGARLIGGCCQVGPEDIRELARRLAALLEA